VKTLEGAQRFPDVRLVRLGSESASTDDFAAYRKHFGDECILFLTLSSSETGNTTQFRMTRNDAVTEERLPVGFPADGIEVLLLDERGREVPTGETGEVAVRGRHLSPGYWRNESLTAERFSKGSGSEDLRVFYSGDLARRSTDGLLHFMGRKDTRVKVHGYRVELSEIEDTLTRQPEVERAVVVARSLPDGDTQLVAYVIPRPGQTCAAETLRHALRTTLPGYMVPGAFVFLTEFPITPHGKIDRQALPLPDGQKTPARRILKPRDVVERNLARIFESVLGLSPVGRGDDFFDLGGTSLQSVEVLAAIEEVFDVALPPSALVEHSTVERLAPLLSEQAVIRSSRPLVVLRTGGGGRPLFLVHSGQGDVVTYGLLVRKLRERPIYGLQAIGLQGESWPLMDIPAMAARYLPEILAQDPEGPYLLAGTCMGGIVAFELAQRLVLMGRTVNLVALIDSPTPPYSGRRSRWHEAMLDPLRDAFRMLRWGAVRASGWPVKVGQVPAYRRFVAGMTGRANRRYHPAYYPGTITLILTTDTKFAAGDRRRLMARYARETRMVTVPGNRTGLFVRPAVDELAREFQACLDFAESGRPLLDVSLADSPVKRITR
jgi:acyl carrier protein/pimeloyl-ACP methyl ester carboxylesterase